MADPARTTDAALAPTQAPAAPQTAPATDTGTPGSVFGLLADGSFLARLGSGVHLSAEELAERGVSLEDKPQPVPGVRLRRASYSRGNRRLTLTGDLAIPHVASGQFTIRVDSEGRAQVQGRLERVIAVPALGNPHLRVSIDESGVIAGSVNIEGADLAPRRLRGLTATGSGTLMISAGRLSGNGTVEMAYDKLGAATINFRFAENGDFAADGTVRITPPFANEITGNLAVDSDNNLAAEVTVDASAQSSPIPGLTLSAGSITVGYNNGQPSAALANFEADYSGLGKVTIATAAFDRNNHVSGSGSFALTVPMMDEVSGTVQLRNGAVSGSLTISASEFPEGLPVSNGRITARLSEAGQVGFDGTVTVNLGPAGTGELSASYTEAGVFSMGAEVDLTVPGLQTVHLSVAYREGQIEGEIGIPVNNELIPGLDGQVIVRFAEGRWSGETTLAYSAENGKLSGSITVTVGQNEEGALELGGSGSVTAQLAPRLSGTLTATILPEGGVDVSGAIEVTEPLELFPEKRMDKELFKYSQNIPLWAILVAVIRVRAGVRAGVGPGVFRNIRVEGSYTLGSEEADPSFSISGEMYIPAFVEGYVAFGAGLGLDVVLGSLTGGIEAVGTAGLYGAISVVPELSYADGDWEIEGTATLAAGARLKLGLNAWAEVEALWITVWEQEWKLAEYVMPVGPDLGLQARMSYKFGQPEPPVIEMNSSDIDTELLIQDAMPKDGPAGSGAREALENKAEWQGALRERRKTPVPPEVAAEAQTPATPPQPAQQKPAHPAGPPAGGAQAQGEGANQDPGAQPTPGNEPARSDAVDNAAAPDPSAAGTVPDSEVPNADQQRYPGPITLATLDEPPAPMPRTRTQEGEDIDAAKQAVDLASREASDSDALDNYFPRIKRRFGLSSLGYEGDFQRGFQVVGKINPEFKDTVKEPLSGTGLPSNLPQGHISKIEFQGSNLAGQPVGIKMTASPLGPDHPLGSEPSGQTVLMNILPKAGDYPEKEQHYIRGHLLNAQLGGPGTPVNMFPITGYANIRHLSGIERQVKDWINMRRLWATYTVEIKGKDEIATTASGIKYINATLVAKASVLDTQLQPVTNLTREVSIASTYGDKAEALPDVEELEAVLKAQTARPEDVQAQVQLLPESAVQRDMTFPQAMESVLKERIAARGRSWVAEKLRGYTGFGDKSETVLFKAYDEVKRRRDKTVNGLTPDEVPVFSRVRNAWGELSKLL